MKKLILSLAMLTATIAFAQKKEIANAVKAVDSGDLTTANSELSKAEGMFGEKTYLLEPSVLEQYYYAKGLSLLKSGKSTEGAEYLAKINTLGSEDIYSGKDADKNKVYFVGKELADKFGNGISPLHAERQKVRPSGSCQPDQCRRGITSNDPNFSRHRKVGAQGTQFRVGGPGLGLEILVDLGLSGAHLEHCLLEGQRNFQGVDQFECGKRRYSCCNLRGRE